MEYTCLVIAFLVLSSLVTLTACELYTKCGFSSNIRHDTWYDQIFTNSPVLFPTNDNELCEIISTAKSTGCKVRVRGAGHSEDGLVMQKLDELSYEVVVVNLKDYTPTGIADDGSTGEEWNGVLNKATDSVKVPTGWSTLELMGTIRPQGYLTKTNTAGRIFSVGGAYLNPSVNGNVIEESRFAAQVRSVRVMDSSCSTRVISGDSVKDWRGSAGLLGVVTAVEIDVVEDTGLTMTRSSISTASFDDAVVRSWIESEYRDNDGVEFFYYVYDDVVDALEGKYSGGTPITPSLTQGYYDEEIARNPHTAFVGGNPNGLIEFVELTAGIIEGDRNLATLVQRAARDTKNNLFDQQAQMPRDGYFLEPDQVANFNVITSNIPCASDCVDESTELLKMSREFLRQITNNPYSNWYPNLPLEWRVYTVQPNEMTLEHLTPGKYVSADLLALRVGSDGLASSRHLMALQEMWRERFPGTAIHHSKGYGYQRLPGYGHPGDAVQYQNDEVLDSVYSLEVRKAFKAKMQQYDPTGVFAAGSFLRLLGMTDDKFTPKQYNGDGCFEWGDNDCISGCCDKVLFDSVNHVCLPIGKGLNEECSETCECSPGLSCRLGAWPPEDWFIYACRE